MRVAVALLMVPAAVVVLGVLTYGGGQGGELSPMRLGMGLAVGCALVAWPVLLGVRRGGLLSLLVLTLAGLFLGAQRPSHERDWQQNVSRLPRATVEGRDVTLHNVRDFRYDAEGEVLQARWYDATYNLDEIERAYFVLTTFGGVPGVAHVMVSFEFADERFVVLSAEARREEEERYDPLGGMFRQYELFYVVADERDALGLRTQTHKDPTWVIPMNAGPEKTAEFFVNMVERLEHLAGEPQWYHTVLNSCSSNLATHYERINQVSLPPDYRVLLPGFSEELIAELDLLPEGMTPEQARERFQINAVAESAPLNESFSWVIRGRASSP
ncbi:hypothetical protein DL240_03160 [Lujinxingia litoralis]|uniref:Lnb N-terminal periplasmic domain-containing protein n=1 Tax=Lujinxingia litoralis TaxID=2211119 RepID=A0A328CBI4_9DELT|nr:DUF4105 domain-containing protein [Lujinxingia litoralis]RAL25224.1 hypothetical protein DL240_03160 [Lujinxingia litoralis]